MKIKSIRIWRFQCFGPRDTTKDSDKTPTLMVMLLDDEITAMIGRDGSGTSALLAAFLRLFGETREERDVKPEDFFFPPGSTLRGDQQTIGHTARNRTRRIKQVMRNLARPGRDGLGWNNGN